MLETGSRYPASIRRRNPDGQRTPSMIANQGFNVSWPDRDDRFRPRGLSQSAIPRVFLARVFLARVFLARVRKQAPRMTGVKSAKLIPKGSTPVRLNRLSITNLRRSLSLQGVSVSALVVAHIAVGNDATVCANET